MLNSYTMLNGAKKLCGDVAISNRQSLIGAAKSQTEVSRLELKVLD